MKNFLGIPETSKLVQIDEALFYQRILKLTKRATKARDMFVLWDSPLGEEIYSLGKASTITDEQRSVVEQCIAVGGLVSNIPNSAKEDVKADSLYAVPAPLKNGVSGAVLCVIAGGKSLSKDGIAAIKDAAHLLSYKKSEHVRKRTFPSVNGHDPKILSAFKSAQLSPGVVFQWRLRADNSHGFDYISDGCREVFGLEPNEIVESSERIIDSIHIEDRLSFNQNIIKSLATMQPFVWTGRYLRGDGGMRWLYATSNPEPQPDGSTVWYGIAHDFTDVKEREKATIQSARQEFETVFDDAPVLMWMKDLDGHYIRANKMFLEHLEYPAEEVIGRTDSDRMNDTEDSALQSATRECIITGQRIVVDHGVNALNGKRVRYTIYPLTDKYGIPFAVCGVGIDITKKKQLEFELQETTASLIQKLDQRTESLTIAHEEILERLSRAAEYRDDDTGLHIHRIARYSEAIAEAAGVGETERDMIRRAAPLHDIGKIGIPDDVLLKRDSLDEQEWATMKRHALIGASMLAGGETPLMRTAEAIALTHHERWDGTGYPNGLKGEQIPLCGRIVAIADAFDALTSERPYKEAWTFDEAVKEIQASAHTHFDPHLVDVFLSILPKIREIHDSFYNEAIKDEITASDLRSA